MIEDLYALIKTQQYPPPFFSMAIHNTVLQSILTISKILAVGLTEIWRCKAATINPSQKHPTKRKRSDIETNTTTTTTPTNIITKYFRPITVTSVAVVESLSTKLSPTTPITSTQLSLSPFLQPQSVQQDSQLQYAFQPPYDDTILIYKFSIPITKAVIQCFNPHQSTHNQWLNDEVINFYLHMLNERFSSTPNKLHIFLTYFMEFLSPTRTSYEVTAFDYSRVSRQTHTRNKNINLFQKEMILIPINYHNQHWTLAVIYPTKKEVVYLDSLSNSNHKADSYLHIIQRYLQEEASATHTVFSPSEWLFHSPTVPRQINGYDCGIYLLLFAHLSILKIPITSIHPQDIATIRSSICTAILTTTVPSLDCCTNVPTPSTSLVLPTSTFISTRTSSKRKAAFTESYNEEHLARKQCNLPTDFICPPDLHLHPTDTFANKRAGIATSRIASGGLGLFGLRELEIDEIIGHYYGGVKITKENLHLHLPSLYAFFDDHNNIFIDPYDPITNTISCSTAYANDNIQNPERNNAQLSTYTDGTASLRVIKKILQYEEICFSYGSDHWKTLLYPLHLLLIAQKAYHKEKDPEWILLIATKRAMEEEEAYAACNNPSFTSSTVQATLTISPPPPQEQNPPSSSPQEHVPNTSSPSPTAFVQPSQSASHLIPREELSPHPEPVPGDGNCLFHAVAQQLNDLNDSTITHNEIRNRITPWLLANSQTVAPTGNQLPLYLLATTLTYDSENNPKWKEYIQRMSTITTYAEQPQLWAIASTYKLRIQVYSKFEYPTIIPIGSQYHHTLYLQYQEDRQHCFSLVASHNHNQANTQHVHNDPQPQLFPSVIPTQQHSEPIAKVSVEDTTQQEQVMHLPMNQLQLIISFSSHIAAINYLQSQVLQHQQWIKHQLHHLLLLETNHQSPELSFLIVQLELQLYITEKDTYSPEFQIMDIYHMLYYIPHIGIFTPMDNNQIKLKYITTYKDTNTFPCSLLMSYITNTPTVCLISDSDISILQIKDTYIHQLVLNSSNGLPQPTPAALNPRKRNIEEVSTPNIAPPTKTYKTTYKHRASESRYYYNNRKTILQKSKIKHRKTGIIQILNENPNTDIEQLLKAQTISTTLSLSIPSTTNKSWTEVLTFTTSNPPIIKERRP